MRKLGIKLIICILIFGIFTTNSYANWDETFNVGNYIEDLEVETFTTNILLNDGEGPLTIQLTFNQELSCDYIVDVYFLNLNDEYLLDINYSWPRRCIRVTESEDHNGLYSGSDYVLPSDVAGTYIPYYVVIFQPEEDGFNQQVIYFNDELTKDNTFYLEEYGYDEWRPVVTNIKFNKDLYNPGDLLVMELEYQISDEASEKLIYMPETLNVNLSERYERYGASLFGRYVFITLNKVENENKYIGEVYLPDYLIPAEWKLRWLELNATYTLPNWSFVANAKGSDSFDINQSLFRVTNFNMGDVSNKIWYFDTIREVFDLGLMTGTTSTTFSPDGLMTRGMVATVLYRMAGSPYASYNSYFSDVLDGEYYSLPITWAIEEGIMNGYESGLFGPDDIVTREQLAVMLRNYAMQQGIDTSCTSDLTQFMDTDEISNFAFSSLQWLVEKNIISGSNNGTLLKPTASATRAECAKMLLLTYKLINGIK